jgi:RNA methyltransferase, TrmH family
MGAHFRLPIITAPQWSDVAHSLQGLPLWLAEARDAEPYDALDWTGPCALGVGGEAAGFSAEAHELAAGRVAVPMAGPVESLNAAVAAAVLMFEVSRQRRRRIGAQQIVR